MSQRQNTSDSAPTSGETDYSATLLVVDDEVDIREPLREHLQDTGFRVFDAENGQAALDVISRETIDLVILDIMMPGMSGLDVCRHLNEIKGPPVILLTALTDDVDKIVGLELGADDYVSKPFNPRELVARVRSVLRRTASGSTEPTSTDTTFGGWTWRPGRGELQNTDGTVVMLSSGETKLLNVFVSKPN
ncbi:MAG: response regulator, partial [Pseudomonadota bacterium]